MTREEITNSEGYKLTKAALEWYDSNQDLDAIDAFEAGAEWAIDEAYEWLEKNADTYIGVEGYAMLQDKFFEDFRKAMEEKK